MVDIQLLADVWNSFRLGKGSVSNWNNQYEFFFFNYLHRWGKFFALGTKGRLKRGHRWLPSLFISYFPPFSWESFLKKIKTTKLQVALPLIFVIITEPWSHAFLHSLSHIVRTKKNVLHGYRQCPWWPADNSASMPPPATFSSVSQQRSLETHFSEIFPCLFGY